MKWRPSIPSSHLRPKGLTLLELLLATVIGLVIIGISIALVLSNRRVFDLDRARTELNQNLRSAMDVMGSDIRQAGELLPPNFPAILLSNGAGTTPDQVVLRRNRIDALTVCQAVSQNSTSGVVVAEEGSTQPGCAKIGTGTHQPLARWDTYRQANGSPNLDAYIFNPNNKLGEFFSFSGTENTTTLARSGGSWGRDYPVGSQLYILEERAYRLNNNVLQLSQNGGTWQGVATNISNLQLTADLKSGTTTTTVDTLDASNSWVTVQGITVRLTGQIVNARVNLNRTLEAQFLPRNARWQ